MAQGNDSERLKKYIESLRTYWVQQGILDKPLKEKHDSGPLPFELKPFQLALNYFSIFLNPVGDSPNYRATLSEIINGRAVYKSKIYERQKEQLPPESRDRLSFIEGGELEEKIFREIFPEAP